MHRVRHALLVIAAGCSGGGEGSTVTYQSRREAMAILCGAGGAPDLSSVSPGSRGAAVQSWLSLRIKNGDGRALLAGLIAMAPAQRDAAIRKEAKRAGIENCTPLRAIVGLDVQIAGVVLPQLPGDAGTVEVDQDRAVLAATPHGIAIDGTQTATVQGGAIDDTGRSRIETALAAATRRDQVSAISIAADPEIEAGLLFQLLDLSRQVGVQEVAFLVSTGADVRALPLEMPRASTGGEVRSVVRIELDREAVAVNGVRIPLAPAGPRTAELRRLVTRAGPTAAAVLLPDARTSMQVLVEVFAAARADADGKPLIRDIALGMVPLVPPPPAVEPEPAPR